MILLNTKTIWPFTLAEKCRAAKAAGFDGLEVWSEEIDDNSFDLIRDFGLTAVSFIGLKGWFECDGSLMGTSDDWQSIFDECKRRIDQALMVRAKYMICVPSRNDRGRYASWDEGVVRYRQLILYARHCGIELLFEFVGASGQVNEMTSANKFLTDVGCGALVVDSYHLWRGDSPIVASQHPVALLHLSSPDKRILRENHRDRDRLVPDSHFNWHLFFQTFGADKDVSLGVYNELYWRDPSLTSIIGYDSVLMAKQQTSIGQSWLID